MRRLWGPPKSLQPWHHDENAPLAQCMNPTSANESRPAAVASDASAKRVDQECHPRHDQVYSEQRRPPSEVAGATQSMTIPTPETLPSYPSYGEVYEQETYPDCTRPPPKEPRISTSHMSVTREMDQPRSSGSSSPDKRRSKPKFHLFRRPFHRHNEHDDLFETDSALDAALHDNSTPTMCPSHPHTESVHRVLGERPVASRYGVSTHIARATMDPDVVAHSVTEFCLADPTSLDWNIVRELGEHVHSGEAQSKAAMDAIRRILQSHKLRAQCRAIRAWGFWAMLGSGPFSTQAVHSRFLQDVEAILENPLTFAPLRNDILLVLGALAHRSKHNERLLRIARLWARVRPGASAEEGVPLSGPLFAIEDDDLSSSNDDMTDTPHMTTSRRPHLPAIPRTEQARLHVDMPIALMPGALLAPRSAPGHLPVTKASGTPVSATGDAAVAAATPTKMAPTVATTTRARGMSDPGDTMAAPSDHITPTSLPTHLPHITPDAWRTAGRRSPSATSHGISTDSVRQNASSLWVQSQEPRSASDNSIMDDVRRSCVMAHSSANVLLDTLMSEDKDAALVQEFSEEAESQYARLESYLSWATERAPHEHADRDARQQDAEESLVDELIGAISHVGEALTLRNEFLTAATAAATAATPEPRGPVSPHQLRSKETAADPHILDTPMSPQESVLDIPMDGPVQPSAKALGKRRAVDPDMIDHTQKPPLPPLPLLPR